MWLDNLPPTSTSVTIRAGSTLMTFSRTLPSSTSSCAPAATASNNSGWGSSTRVESPGAGSRSKSEALARRDHRRPAREIADAKLGPLEVEQDRRRPPKLRSNPRIAVTSAALSAWSPWLMLIRNASAPARISASIIAGSDEAGPSVASTFTLRARGGIAGMIAMIVPLAVPAA